eukprot:Skav202464  [mRNA]  locus=scaffold149:385199:387944:+ [translate_table: standard]
MTIGDHVWEQQWLDTGTVDACRLLGHFVAVKAEESVHGHVEDGAHDHHHRGAQRISRFAGYSGVKSQDRVHESVDGSARTDLFH